MTRIHVFDMGKDLGLPSINGLRNPTFLFVKEPIVTMFIFAILAIILIYPMLCVLKYLLIYLLYLIGFGAQGPIVGSLAAAYQALFGPVAAGSFFSIFQGWAMGTFM